MGPFHTNTAEGLLLARNILKAQKKDMRQIIMITDGKPSAVTLPDGLIYKNSGGMDQHILSADIPRGIRLQESRNPDQHLHVGTGPVSGAVRSEGLGDRARQSVFTSTQTLGQYIMMDFMRTQTAEDRLAWCPGSSRAAECAEAMGASEVL